MASSQGEREGPARLQRLALLVFGLLFVLLFVGFAIAQGVGNPSIPEDAVAVVEDAPEGQGTVTRAELNRALFEAAAERGVKPAPTPEDDNYDEVAEVALGKVLEAIWIKGQGEEMGIGFTSKEIADELGRFKETFSTEKKYRESVRERHFTEAAALAHIEVQMFTGAIQNAVSESAPAASASEVEDYYEAGRSSLYTLPEVRDVRVIKNRDKAKVEEAKATLEEDDSVENWREAWGDYSTDSTGAVTGSEGGLGEITEDALGRRKPLGEAVFAAPPNELEGPVKQDKTYSVFEVMKISPEEIQSLDEVGPSIEDQISERLEQEAFDVFIEDFGALWQSRTFCVEGLAIERFCRNFKDDGRPLEADEACFEADPKIPAEACMAPIPQVKPALPGSVSPLEPEGQKLAQRPRPAGLEEAHEEGAQQPAEILPAGE